MGLFRKSAASEPLGVTMAGVKLGQRFLAVGARDVKLTAQIATRAGLTGRACVVDDDEARLTKAVAAIEQEGALVEPVRAPYGMWPFEDESFDVAVVAELLPSLTPDIRVRCISEILRVLRPGGRVLIVERAQRGGLVGALIGGARPTAAYEGPIEALRGNGFAAVRQLAEADTITYVEGIKKVGG